MHRFYLSSPAPRGETLQLAGREAHHALQVLRVRENERVLILDGAGHEFSCAVRGHDRHSVSLEVLERKFVPAPPCAVTLIQAIPKGKIMESIIQKATELGVSRIVPVLSERVVTQLNSDDASARAEKWQAVAIEAIKQCGASWLPKVEAPVALPAYLQRAETFELALVACLESGSRPTRECFQEFLARHSRRPHSVAVWIGPEGDFTAAEYSAIQQAGTQPITLGSLVLRVETAAICALAVINSERQGRN